MIHFTKIVAALLILLAVALGGYAAWLSRRPSATPPQPPLASAAAAATEARYPVVVTRHAVTAGLPLTADALRIAQLPVNPSDALHDVASAVGRVPLSNLGEGTPVMETQLATGLALRLSEGERAVAVKADEVMGVGNRLHPGDYVDVFVLLKTDNREIERSQSRLLLPRLRVLAFGALPIDNGAPPPEGVAPATRSAPTGRVEAARTAVLAVPVADVPRLALGDSQGHLLLALRHPEDMAQPQAELFADLPGAIQPQAGKAGATQQVALSPIDRAEAGLALDDLASGGATTAPKHGTAAMAIAASVARVPSASPRRGPAPPHGNEVEMIRGDKRETLSY
jgi:pilus assembly protein CpaB